MRTFGFPSVLGVDAISCVIPLGERCPARKVNKEVDITTIR